MSSKAISNTEQMNNGQNESALGTLQIEEKETSQVILSVSNALEKTNDGRPVASIQNFQTIVAMDTAFCSSRGERFNTLRWNVFNGNPEILATDPTTNRSRYVSLSKPFISQAMSWIEEHYRLYSPKKLDDALSAMAYKTQYNPIIDRLEHLPEWDGTPRMEMFLTEWACAGDTPYIREVSKLLFATGIRRAYEPGCEIEGAIMLKSFEQGTGKSTFCKALSLGLYTSITRIEGKDGVEVLPGTWLIEIEELKAIQGKNITVDEVKQFLTAVSDRYRAAYARTPEEFPRTCFFIGTTNQQQFLTDPSGNRRFYPVDFKQTRTYLADHEQEFAAAVEQTWAEALALYKQGELPDHFPNELKQAAEEARQDYEIQDEFAPYIEEYLERAIVGTDIEVMQTCTLAPDGCLAVCAIGMYDWINKTFLSLKGKQYTAQGTGRRISDIMSRYHSDWLRGCNPKQIRFAHTNRKESPRYPYWYWPAQNEQK